MQKLHDGIRAFRTQDVPHRKAFYEALAQGQKPECVFVTCSDSRIVVSQMTQTGPGDIFVVRNAGNIVPAFDPAHSGGEWATIEYALNVLKLKDIVVCGHTHCGAVGALISNPDLTGMPSLKRWLGHAAPVLDALKHNYTEALHDDNLQTTAAAENVVHQLTNLTTHPTVRERLDAGQLTLHGWLYDITNGKVYAFDEDKAQFEPLNTDATPFPDRKPKVAAPALGQNKSGKPKSAKV